jgi:uncharacterized protein (DUF1015 family)
MAIVRPFKGLRPAIDKVEEVASLPYDVMNREEAKAMAEGKDWSFLHVVRPEVDLPDEVDLHDDSAYAKARENLDKFQAEGVLVQDEAPVYYIYRQLMFGRVQTGIVACTSIDEYMDETIKKHEFTRPEKEQDRIRNFDTCDANTAPIFLTYRRHEVIHHATNEWIKFNRPVYQFTSDDDIQHIVWKIDEPAVVAEIQKAFNEVEYLYIADGHHRSASSVKVGMKRRKQFPNFTGEEEFNFFMSVIFPDEDLFIMDYNRVVEDLNGATKEEFLAVIEKDFAVEAVEAVGPYHPKKKHEVGMILDGKWYRLTMKAGSFDAADPVGSLDCAILQDNLLQPILGIEDPRTSNRIQFIGGIRGLEELEKRVATDMVVGFAMYPTTIEDLIDVADAGRVMPPKSTWFEPKLRSGLFVHKLSE